MKTSEELSQKISEIIHAYAWHALGEEGRLDDKTDVEKDMIEDALDCASIFSVVIVENIIKNGTLDEEKINNAFRDITENDRFPENFIE